MESQALGTQQVTSKPAGDPLHVGLRTERVGACPMCAAVDSQVMFQIPDRLHSVPGEFTYRRCLSCRTVFQDPRVIQEDLRFCYPENYYTHTQLYPNKLDTLSTESASRRFPNIRDSLRRSIVASIEGRSLPGVSGSLGWILAQSRIVRQRAFYGIHDEMIPQGSSSMKALEVGCGRGYFMLALQNAGWDVEGVEWDPVAAEIARKNSKRLVIVGDFRTANLPEAAYGLIVMHHVFEHIDDPLSALLRIGELLAPGGRAVLVYPNPESLGAKVFKDAWFPWEAPRHLVLPPGDSAVQLARSAGLVPIKWRTITSCAEIYYAYSRAHRSHNPVDSVHLNPGDHFLAALTRALVRVGLKVGEEVVVLIKKPNLSR